MLKVKTVDEYIGAQPEPVQEVLRKVRETVRSAVPGLGERISYSIPAFTLGGKDLLYMAAWKNFLSVYPLGEVEDESLEREVSPYRAAKATLRFPLAKPIPYDTIARVARHRAGDRVPTR